MAEVQQTSDATFRLFDWNRRDARGQMRQLHLEEALACIDWNGGPIHPVRAEGYPGNADSIPSTKECSLRQELVRCPYFTLDYLRRRKPFTCGGIGRLQVLLVLHGRGQLETGEGVWELARGDTLLLPAALGPLVCHPEGDLGTLLSTLPSTGLAD
jgi:mannose-6-phosphate isomerase